MTSVRSHAPPRAKLTTHSLLPHRIAAAATRWPESVAVACGDATLRYAELEAASNQFARRLRALGVQPAERVAILADRSVEMIVAVLGILKAGCAYVPLDSANPAERLAFLLADAGACAVVLNETQRALLPAGHGTVVSLDADREAVAREDAGPLPDLVRSDAVAYVIYTSGSTGQPKGVEIEQRSVLAFLEGLAPHITFRPGDVHAAVASLSFDMSVLDLFATLTSGASLLLVPRDIVAHPQAMSAYLARHGATSLQATPTAWRMLVESGWVPERGFRVLSGGEALSRVLADKLTSMVREVWNLYGPTEATVYAYIARIGAGDAVHLGHPIGDTTGHVLDDDGVRVARGAEGLLFLGGAQVARGYWKRPELTAERFVLDRFSDQPGARLYNTGDIVRTRDDGTLEYVGRRDDQVKVRGYRVELGEIEGALARHERVVSAAVVVHRKSIDDDPRLIAYVTVGKAARRTGPRKSVYVPVVTMLRQFVAQSLPPHMVPERVVVLNAMPVTVAGKIDRVKLAAMPLEQTMPEFVRTGAVIQPRSDLERRLAEVFERVLDIRPISMTDNFFDLGATSVAAARLFTEIERQIGPDLPLAPLFTAPTIETLARLISERMSEARPHSRSTSLVAIQPLGTRLPIFCVHGGVGTILHFRTLSRHLGDDQPFYGLQMQGLEGGKPLHTSVEAMARHYVREIAELQPRGPYIVAGYCFGAIVAQEMARTFAERGERVALLMSFNGPSAEFIRQRTRDAARMWELPPPRNVLDAVLRPAKRLRWANWRQLKRRAEYFRVRTLSATGAVFAHDARLSTIPLITRHIEQTHITKPWRGSMLVAQSETIFKDADIGWNDVPGIDVETHVSTAWGDDQRLILVEPAVVWLADIVRTAVDRVMTPA